MQGALIAQGVAMFALPFSAAFAPAFADRVAHGLGNHVFGRFAESPPQDPSRQAPALPETGADDGLEDLAQRVREIGEW